MSDEGITEADFLAAFDRIAREPDGHLVYLYFQKTLCAVSTDDSALPRVEGRRSYAAELMGLMAKGIAESGGSSRNTPVVFARREPVAIHSRVTAREFLRANPDADPTITRPE
jgi:hypothetical protein